MARVIEQTVVVRLSKLVRDNDLDMVSIVNEDMVKNIEEAVQNLVSDIVIVEAEEKV